MQLDTAEPKIRTAQNTSNSPVPYDENGAKKKLKDVIKNNFAIKVTVNRIKHSELLILFNHQNGGKYYLKSEYHGNDKAITSYMSENKNKFSCFTI